MAVSQTCNLQFSLKVSVSDDNSREEDNCTWRFFEFLCATVTPRWHQGRVSVSFYLPVTGWSQACPHAWDTTKQRHLTLSNRRHVLRCRKPSDFVTCGTLPIVVSMCNNTIFFNTTHVLAQPQGDTCVNTCDMGSVYKVTALIKNQTDMLSQKSNYLDMR